MPIAIREDHKRGCGWRKPGGLYMVAGGLGRDCGRLPIELNVCPCCGQGIKPTRGWTWVDADKLVENNVCLRNSCRGCPLAVDHIGMAGLLWIGGEFYATPDAFNNEAAQLGISRRISAVPNDFVVGQTWVLLAHRKGICEISGGKEDCRPAIFRMFKPQAIEYVVTGKESKEQIKSLERRGITPVKIRRVGETQNLL